MTNEQAAAVEALKAEYGGCDTYMRVRIHEAIDHTAAIFAQARVATEEEVERVTAAIKDADESVGYSIRLHSLIEGVSTYRLTFEHEPGTIYTYGSHADASEHTAEYRSNVRARAAIAAMSQPTQPQGAADYVQLVREHDAQVDRLKACEHIANGDEGWEALRNECPSTAAVAALRDRVNLLAEPVTLTRSEVRSIVEVYYGAPPNAEDMIAALHAKGVTRIKIEDQ